MIMRLFRFLTDRRGATSTEFAIVAVVFFASMIAVVDFGRALWSYNRAVKACQLGVRYAVVNDMVAMAMKDYSGIDEGDCNPGDPVPLSAFSVPIECDDDSCNSGGRFQAAYDEIVEEMATVFPQIGTDGDAQVTVTYEHIGLGLCGNPYGPDVWPLVTVEMTGLTFDFITPFVNLTDFTFPECRASLTGEDFQT